MQFKKPEHKNEFLRLRPAIKAVIAEMEQWSEKSGKDLVVHYVRTYADIREWVSHVPMGLSNYEHYCGKAIDFKTSHLTYEEEMALYDVANSVRADVKAYLLVTNNQRFIHLQTPPANVMDNGPSETDGS